MQTLDQHAIDTVTGITQIIEGANLTEVDDDLARELACLAFFPRVPVADWPDLTRFFATLEKVFQFAKERSTEAGILFPNNTDNKNNN
jgi:hypothetical protein